MGRVLEHPPRRAVCRDSATVACRGQELGPAARGEEAGDAGHGRHRVRNVFEHVNAIGQVHGFDATDVESFDRARVQIPGRQDDLIDGNVQLIRVGAGDRGALVVEAAQQGAGPEPDLEDGGRFTGANQRPVGEGESGRVKVRLATIRMLAMGGGRKGEVADEMAAGDALIEGAAPIEMVATQRGIANLTSASVDRLCYRLVTHGATLAAGTPGAPGPGAADGVGFVSGDSTGGVRAPMRILYFTWRDQEHPEAGGSEVFVERTAQILTERGHEVTLFTALFKGGRPHDRHGRVDVVRRGGRFTVYGQGMRFLRAHAADFDVVIDVQNGVPFWSPLTRTRPVVIIVHHIHREVWRTIFGPYLGAFGWLLESRVAPVVYRRARYVTVSKATMAELTELGVDADRTALIYSGNDQPDNLADFARVPRSTQPSIAVLGRLVPHKQVELAIDVVADLSALHPDLVLDVIGTGYWHDEIAAHAQARGVGDRVRMHGFVDDDTKHRLLASSWLALMPSRKEGWGLTIVEAGLHGTPAIAFADSGGPTESIIDGETGLIAANVTQMRAQVQALLADAPERERLGSNAREYARTFEWSNTAEKLEQVLYQAISDREAISDPSHVEAISTGS